MDVTILFNEVPSGAGPDEVDVLVQVEAIAQALNTLGHTVQRLACSLNLDALGTFFGLGVSPKTELEKPHNSPFHPPTQPTGHARRKGKASSAVVFNLVEALGGQGRLIHVVPALLEAWKIPYTGSPAEALALTSNKLQAKLLLSRAGLPTPAWWTVEGTHSDPTQPGRKIIKPIWEHASLGMDDGAVIEEEESKALGKRIARRSALMDRSCFAEAFVEGREFNLSVLAGPDGPMVLDPAEITFEDFPPEKPRIVGYEAKWIENSFAFSNTRRRFDFPATDKPLLEDLSDLARRTWNLFGLRGYARVDFRVGTDGQPWILEVNANPCLSPDAGFAASLERSGISYPEAIARILADALEEEST